MRLNSPKYCNDIQPILLQFLMENIERFFCNLAKNLEASSRRNMKSTNYGHKTEEGSRWQE